jgi:glutamate-ammonia-ligase adenylyltransferase
LATQIGGFADYQENDAWTWEHMALTRARVMNAPARFGKRVEEVLPLLDRFLDDAILLGSVHFFELEEVVC